MFEHIVMRRSEGGQPVTAGQIAEALFYYQKLHLFIDRETLVSLIKQIGTGGVLTLLKRTDVSAVYCEELLATSTSSIGVLQCHNFVTIVSAGPKDAGQFKTPRERLKFDLERHGVPKDNAKRFSKIFFQTVPIRRFSGNYYISGGIPAAAKLDLLDIENTKMALRQAVATMPGGYVPGDDLTLNITESDLGFFVFTNLDLEKINKRLSKVAPTPEPITLGHLLSNLLEARADFSLASFYGGDFVTSASRSAIIRTRHQELLKRTALNKSSRDTFIEMVLPDSPSIAEVIDSGERSLDEFFHLLDKAARFKGWLKQVNPDENLIRTYTRDITSEGWIQRLPAKVLRYMFNLGLEVTHPTAALAASLADHFLIEKLLSGWRPNHFVTGKLQPFVRGD